MLTIQSFEVAERPVGEGSTARVFAVRLEDGRRAALKIAKSEAMGHILADEGERLAWLDLPGAPRMLDAGWQPEPKDERSSPLAAAEERPSLVLSWVPGVPLHEAWKDGARLALVVARDIGALLASMERVGISHGDLKPENLLVLRGAVPRVSLVDLGLGGPSLEPVVGGTPRYLPPEMRLGGGARMHADRYALGVVLAELISREARVSDDPAATFLALSPEHPLGDLVTSIFTAPAAARPSPAFVCSVAKAAMGKGDAASETEDTAVARIRSAYVAVRWPVLQRAASASKLDVDPACAPWVRETLERVRAARALTLPRARRPAMSSAAEPTVRGAIAALSEAASTVAPPRPLDARSVDELVRVTPLDQAGRVRWLAAIVGPAAVRWPIASLSSIPENALARALVALAQVRSPSAWTLGDVERAVGGDLGRRRVVTRDLIELGLELGRRPVSESVLAEIETRIAEAAAPSAADGTPGAMDGAPSAVDRAPSAVDRAPSAVDRAPSAMASMPSALHAAWIDAVRRQGEPARALLSLRSIEPSAMAPEILVAAAEAARRLGDLPRCERLCAAVLSSSPVGAVRPDGTSEARRAMSALSRAAVVVEGSLASSVMARARSIVARLTLEREGPREATRVLDEGDPTELDPAIEEARALIALAAHDLDEARRASLRGLAVAYDDESRARLMATLGYIAHAAGQSESALSAFREAATLAERAGAVVEEASYRTGEAAAAVDTGAIESALDASSRAIALWESLSRHADAARACLSRAAALRVGRALDEAAAAASDAGYLAQRGNDDRARCYATLVLADARLDDAPELDVRALKDEGQRRGDEDDGLRIFARLHRRGAVPASDLLPLDTRARSSSAVASLEWWEARISAFLASPSSLPPPAGRLPDALAMVLQATAKDAPLDARGAALDAARRLAIHLGDAAAARRCRTLQAGLAARLVTAAPASMRAAIQRAAWVDAAAAPVDAGTNGGLQVEQIDDVVALVRTLTARDRLRPLLEQILDALILWTGVERGVLLLPAPNGKLVPRVARNLSRADLRGEQLRLSTSLAARAASERRTVIAVDAAGESADARASVHLLQLRSVLAIPLISGGAVLGVVYLDDRIRRGAFGQQEVAWVDLVAGIAALAVADTRDQLLLRRAIRRAERASLRLSRLLDEKSSALDAMVQAADPLPVPFAGRARFREIVGISTSIGETIRLADRVSKSEIPVLITGESGSGKELFARAIHRNGPRGSAGFVSENCAAIPEPLLESALFGHVRGAFTGATDRRVGLFELAHRGTLFLDEIGEMSLPMQSKLLRVLSDGEVRAVGASTSRKVDVRIIAATHRDLRELVREGKFREDLFYRLCVVEVRVPPLRERTEDIPILVKHLIAQHAPDTTLKVTPAAMNALCAYPWPGNVRQLENEIRRALVLAEGNIEPSQLSSEVAGPRSPSPSTLTTGSLLLRERVDGLERDLIGAALSRTRGNQSKAAALLGVSRFGLQKMMKRLDIQVEAVTVHAPARMPSH